MRKDEEGKKKKGTNSTILEAETADAVEV